VWEDYVEFDPRYLRPAEVELLIGDSTKAQTTLGWKPSVTFTELVHLMVDTDLQALGLRSPNFCGGEILADTAVVRQALATMHD
jgi:GDPmannose 4,6-dehydratase